MLTRIILTLCFSCIIASSYAQSDVANVVQIYIRFKPHVAHQANTMLTANEAADLSNTAGVVLKPNTVTTDNRHYMGLPRPMTRAEAWAIATKLAKRPDLADVAPIDPEFRLVPPHKPYGAK